MWERLKTWARLVKRDILVLYFAGRDPRVPWYAKGMALVTVAYALSPIGLIPDFIPIIGYLDDLIILPVAIYIAVRMVPAPIIAELREKAAQRLSTRLPGNRTAAIMIVVIWLSFSALVGFMFFSAFYTTP